MVQTFALALHELATNASKHGALAQPGARLAVRWHVEPASEPGRQHLCVDWREGGVVMPQAGARSGNGYGRELIEHALPYQLGAKTTYGLGADGVHCTLCLPIESDALAARDRDT
jgi:two-component sensor histidine kinase